MPLLHSPIDGSPMRQIKRYGIEIDMCPTTGGVWLDRGELEKLISLLQGGAANANSRTEALNEWDSDEDEDFGGSSFRYMPRNGSRHGNNNREQEGPLSKIMDLFEF